MDEFKKGKTIIEENVSTDAGEPSTVFDETGEYNSKLADKRTSWNGWKLFFMLLLFLVFFVAAGAYYLFGRY